MHCSTCANDTVVAIHMRIGGEDVTFRRCSVCETNHWNGLAGDLALTDILELARAPR
jgi:hypothetical protein